MYMCVYLLEKSQFPTTTLGFCFFTSHQRFIIILYIYIFLFYVYTNINQNNI